MNTKKNKQDDEIYILGSTSRRGKGDRTTIRRRWIILSIGLAIIIFGSLFLILSYINNIKKEETIEYYFEPEETLPLSITVETAAIDDVNQKGYIETQEETVNEITLLVHTPYHVTMSLSLGKPDKSDSTIIFITQAADIRKDNKRIVAEFVLEGKQIARGLSKKGFCAVVDHTISIGMADETPLLQQSIESNGFFFRQYPLVYHGEPITNNPVNKSIRRALAVRNEQVIMVESTSALSFHDFSQALVDIGVSDAIYLVGGRDAHGWYYNKESVRHEYGIDNLAYPDYTSFIVWRTK